MRKIEGWRLSSLGRLYYPSYIHNGIAIHGSVSVPTRAASHGCIRVPIYAAKELSSFLPVGLEVIVYDGGRSAHAQQRAFTADDIEYTLELPSPEWRAVSRLDIHYHVEFIYGNDVANGHLQARKIFSDRASSAVEMFSRDEKLEFQRLPGYVVCSECKGSDFEGHLSGAVFSYRYVSGGKPIWAGSITCSSINGLFTR